MGETMTMAMCACCGGPCPADPPDADPIEDEGELRFGVCDACARKWWVPADGDTLAWSRARIGILPELCR